MPKLPSTSTTTPPRRSIRACSRRCCRTSAKHFGNPAAARTLRLAGRRGGRAGARAGGRAHRRDRARSSSPAARPSRTTWRSRASPNACRERGNHIVTGRSSTRRCSTRSGRSRRGLAASPCSGSMRDGCIDSTSCARSPTRPCSSRVMAANNEIGVLQPLAEIGAIAQRARRAVPLRRGAGGRQDAGRRRGHGHRPAVVDRPQDLRPEGSRRALRAATRRDPAGGQSTVAGTNADCVPAP